MGRDSALSPDFEAAAPPAKPTKRQPVTREQTLKRKRERAVQRRLERRDAGMCAKCGDQPPAPDKALCAACAQYESDRWHKKKKGRESIAQPVAKPPKPVAKPPIPGNRRLSLPPCVICGRLINERAAATQMRLHLGSTVHPRCRTCDQRIAQSVRGLRSARAARQDGEGEVAPQTRGG